MPKGTDLRAYARVDLDEIERKVNGRPVRPSNRQRKASGAKSLLAVLRANLVSDRPTLVPSCSSITMWPRGTSRRLTLRHELTLIVSVYGPKVSVEAPKDAVNPLGLGPDEFALSMTLPVL